MDRISKTKKVIKVLAIVFAVSFVIIVGNFLLHIVRTEQFNAQDRSVDKYSDDTTVLVDIHPRGMATDSWEKNDAFPGVILKAKIYEATISNSTGSLLHDWTLRIDIRDDCYINNAWNGTVEIHQFVDGVEKVQELSLQNYKESDITLDYYMCGQDLMIPMTKGDYIIYLPNSEPNLSELEIDSTSTMIGEMNVGLIIYSLSGEDDLSNYELTYYLEKDLFSGLEANIFIIASAIWLLTMMIYLAIIFMMRRYEHSMNRQYTITNEFVGVFVDYIDARERDNNHHSKDVAVLSQAIGHKLGMDKTASEDLYYAGLVHDIGKCFVPDYILKKTTGLTNEEQEIVNQHTVRGAEMLKDCKSIAHLADGAMYHHEHFDGSGFPTGKSGEDIPLVGRIICVADNYAKLRERLDEDSALAEIEQDAGIKYDPTLVEVLCEAVKEKEMENWEVE